MLSQFARGVCENSSPKDDPVDIYCWMCSPWEKRKKFSCGNQSKQSKEGQLRVYSTVVKKTQSTRKVIDRIDAIPKRRKMCLLA
jgi:hypothetical protein